MDGLDINVCRKAPEDWDAFTKGHTDGKLYHRVAWNEMVRDTFGHNILYITVRKNEQLLGILPLTDFKSLLFGHIAVSQPFVNYGGPLLSDPAIAPSLFQFLGRLRKDKGYKSIEIRMGAPIAADVPCKQHKVTFFLELPDDPDDLMTSFKAKVRSQIRRPTKDGMVARTGAIDLLDDFYHVFAINMRDLGTPPLPRRFFENILKSFPGETFVSVVYTDAGLPAAVSFLIRHGVQMEIPWASSLREYNRSSPNMLLYWESLRHSIDIGCRSFDYGRCTPDSGTYRFKRQWGASEVPLHWYYVLPESEALPQMNPENSKFDLFIKIWQKMPLSFTNSVGPLVIKHIP